MAKHSAQNTDFQTKVEKIFLKSPMENNEIKTKLYMISAFIPEIRYVFLNVLHACVFSVHNLMSCFEILRLAPFFNSVKHIPWNCSNGIIFLFRLLKLTPYCKLSD